MKIKNRLTVYFMIIVGLLLSFFSLTIYLLSARYLEKHFTEKFRQKVSLTSSLLIRNGAYNPDAIKFINKKTLNELLGEKFIILSDSLQIIYNSYEGSPHPFSESFLRDALVKNEAMKDNGNETWFGTGFTFGNKKLCIAAAAEKDYLQDLFLLKWLLILLLILSMIIIFFSGRFFSGNALRPIQQIISEVDNITENNLDKKIMAGDNNDEIAQLAQTFNLLLERLEAVFQLQRNFVSNASHELRTPLSTITAQLEVTLLNRRSVEEYQLVLNSVLEDIKDLNRLSEALLDLTLASRDKSLMKFTDVRVDELLFQSREDLLKRKQDYHINIRFSEFPEDEKKLSVYGKEYLLKSAFMNLMDNACKFSSDKTVEVSCEVGVRTIQIHFSDRGIGMPASYIGKIYTPLVRGDNARRYPGHGLGLALCSKIVELHHGSISFISKEGEGTTITITLSTR